MALPLQSPGPNIPISSNMVVTTPSIQRSSGALMEMSQLIDEITGVYTKGEQDDIQTVMAIKQSNLTLMETTRSLILEQETELELLNNRLMHAQQRIRDLGDVGHEALEHDGLEKGRTKGNRKSGHAKAHQVKLEELEREKNATIENIMLLEEECANNKALLASTQASLLARKEELEQSTELMAKEYEYIHKVMPLYGLVSLVRLDYKSADNRIGGFISDRQKNKVTPFEFTVGEQTDYEMINSVWDLIVDSHATAI